MIAPSPPFAAHGAALRASVEHTNIDYSGLGLAVRREFVGPPWRRRGQLDVTVASLRHVVAPRIHSFPHDIDAHYAAKALHDVPPTVGSKGGASTRRDSRRDSGPARFPEGKPDHR